MDFPQNILKSSLSETAEFKPTGQFQSRVTVSTWDVWMDITITPQLSKSPFLRQCILKEFYGYLIGLPPQKMYFRYWILTSCFLEGFISFNLCISYLLTLCCLLTISLRCMSIVTANYCPIPYEVVCL